MSTIPKNIERYLFTLSKIYGHNREIDLQKLIINAKVTVDENVIEEPWGNGHAVYLSLPEQIFLLYTKQKDKTQEKLREDLNSIIKVQGEFIQFVFLEMENEEGDGWREVSGLLVSEKLTIPQASADKIWGKEGFRVFLSHRSDVKAETAQLKERLKLFGISAFVAHEDITPTKAWQDEIVNALGSMDALVALMTPNFHESEWTDQEVGFAIGRSVPIVAVRLGKNPYGFLGKFQALSCAWDKAHIEIAKLLINNDRMISAYIQALPMCPNWGDGNTLAEVLPSIEKLTPIQIDEIISIYNNVECEIRGSFGFNGSKPKLYGKGLVFHLNRIASPRIFVTTPKDFIQEI